MSDITREHPSPWTYLTNSRRYLRLAKVELEALYEVTKSEEARVHLVDSIDYITNTLDEIKTLEESAKSFAITPPVTEHQDEPDVQQ